MSNIFKILSFPVVFPILFTAGTVCQATKGVGKISLSVIGTVEKIVTGGVKEINERAKKETAVKTALNSLTDFIGGTLKGAGSGLTDVTESLGLTILNTLTGGLSSYSEFVTESILNDAEKIKDIIEHCRKNNLKEFKFKSVKGIKDEIKIILNLMGLTGVELNVLNQTASEDTLILIFND